MPKRSPAFREDRRREILAAAERCFAAVGYNAATIREVAAEAGLSTGAVYTYFRTKDGLLAALCAERAASQIAALRAALAAPSAAPARLEAGLAAAFEPFVAASPAEVRQLERANLLAWYEMVRSAEGGAFATGLVTTWRETVLDLLREERDAGRLRADVDLAALAAILIALGPGLQIVDLLQGGGLDWPAVIRALTAVLLGGAVREESRVGSRESEGSR